MTFPRLVSNADIWSLSRCASCRFAIQPIFKVAVAVAVAVGPGWWWWSQTAQRVVDWPELCYCCDVGQGSHDAGFGDEEAAGIAAFCPAVNQALAFTFSFSYSLSLALTLASALVRHLGSTRRFLEYRLPIIPDNICIRSAQARFGQEGICHL